MANTTPTLNWSYRGAPFVRYPARTNIHTLTLDYSWRGAPFVALDSLATVRPPDSEEWWPHGGNPTIDDTYRFGDEGGYVMTLRTGDVWPAGPLFVTLVDDTNAIWPDTGSGCWGCVPGYADALYPSRDGLRLKFVIPALPLGVYDLVVRSGSVGGSLVQEFVGLVDIIRRGRAWPHGYDFAAKFPGGWPVGMRRPQLEDLAEIDNRPPYGGWEAVVKGFGRMFQSFAGAPCTRLREDYDPDDEATNDVLQVETTLGFEEVVRVWVDGLSIRVFGIDRPNRLFLLTTDDLTLIGETTTIETGISGLTPVVLDQRAIPHLDQFVEPGDTGTEVTVEPVTLYEYNDLYRKSGYPYAYIDNPLGAGAEQSWVFWHKLDDSSMGGNIFWGPTTVYLRPVAGGHLAYLADGGGAWDVLARAAATWHCFVVTCDGANHKLYIDGVLAATTASATNLATTQAIVLGQPWANVVPDGGGGAFVDIEYPNHHAANLAAFDRLITADEAAAISTAGIQHDYRVAVDGWEAEVPTGYWRGAPVALVVANIGSGVGVITLDATNNAVEVVA